MKAITRLLLIASAVALLASCASMDDRSTLAPGGARMVSDAEYIAVVEGLAATRGVKVKWVNPPKVRVEDD